jgi:hypothetical protein
MKDYRSSEIVVGAMVAFNYSGDVQLGVVTGFSRSKTKWWTLNGYELIPSILVESLHEPGRISRVKRPTSLVVLATPLKSTA